MSVYHCRCNSVIWNIISGYGAVKVPILLGEVIHLANAKTRHSNKAHSVEQERSPRWPGHVEILHRGPLDHYGHNGSGKDKEI